MHDFQIIICLLVLLGNKRSIENLRYLSFVAAKQMVVPMLGFLLSALGYSILKHISFIVTQHQTIFQNTTVPLKSKLPVASHFTRDESLVS